MAAKDTPVAECNTCHTVGRFHVVQVPYDAVYGYDARVPLCPYCYAMSLTNAVLAAQHDKAAEMLRLPKHPFPNLPVTVCVCAHLDADHSVVAGCLILGCKCRATHG